MIGSFQNQSSTFILHDITALCFLKGILETNSIISNKMTMYSDSIGCGRYFFCILKRFENAEPNTL